MSRPMETLWPLLLIYAMGVSESVIIKDGSVHTSYFFSERRLTVEKTHKFCQAKGGQLIVLDEARKFQNVTALLQDYRSKYDRFYVNAKQKSGKTYLWANGVKVRGAFWGEGQPEVNRFNVQLKLYSGSFMLASSYGGYLRYALCENVTSVSSQVSSSMESTYDLLSSGVYSTMETSESLEMSSYVNSVDPTSAAEVWMSTGGSGTEEMTQTISFLSQTREYPDTDGSISLPSVFSTKSSAVLDTSNSAVSQQNTPTSGSGESQTYAGIQATRLSDVSAQGMLTLTPDMRTEMQASVDDDGQTLGQFGSDHQNMLTESLENSLLTSDCFSDCHTKSVGIDYSETFQSDDFSVVLMKNLFNPVSSALLSTEQSTLPELLDSSATFQSSFVSFKQTSSLPVSSMMTASSSSPVSQPMLASGSVSLTLSESALAMSVAPSLSPLATSRAFSSPTPPFVMSPQATPTSETFLATSVPLLSDQTIPQSPASDLSVLPTSASGLFISRTLLDLFVSPTFHQFDSLASESFVISPTSDSVVPHISTLELFTPLTRTSDLFISEISSSDPVASEASSSDMLVSQMSDSSQFVSPTLVSSEPVLDSLFSQAVGSELQVSVQSDLSSATSEQNVFFSFTLQSQRPFSTPETKTEPLDLPTSESLPVFLEESEATEVLLVTPVSFLSTSLSLSQSVSFSSVAVPLSLESSLSLVASSSASTVISAHVSSTAFVVSVQSESVLASSLLSPENMTPVMLTINISSLYMSAASVPLSLSSLKMTSLLENLPSSPSSSTLIKHSPVSQNLSFFSSATDSSSFTTILMAATLSQNISSMSSLSSLLSSFSTLQATFPSQSLSPELAISSLLSSPSSLPLSLSTVQATVPPPGISSPLSSLMSSSTISQTTSRPQNISSPSSVLSVPTSSQSTSTSASRNRPPWNKQPSPRGSKGTGCCTCRVESKVTDTLSSADVQSAVGSQVARTKAELMLDTAGLSRQQRKRSSATDHRRSSETMGVMSIAILTVMFVIVVGSDLVCSLRYLKQNGHYL